MAESASAAPAGTAAPASTGAATLGEITHGLTLKGGQLCWAILHNHKTIENRHIRLSPGWYAAHIGQGKMDAARAARLATQVGPGLPPEASLPHGCIIGALRIDGSCAIEDCANTPSEEWASGPVCNVVGAVATLPGAPVSHKGALGLWPIDAEARLATPRPKKKVSVSIASSRDGKR